MKRRTLEYDYDWMQWAMFTNAIKFFDGTPKEINGFIKLLPSFEPLLKFLLGQGEGGRLIVKVVDEYVTRIRNASQNGEKLLLSTFMCNQLLFNAFDGLQPMCAEALTGFATLAFLQGNSEYFDYCCEKGFTETSCSAQRGIIGALMADCCRAKPDLCVIGAAGPCDTNANAMQFYADYTGVPLLTLEIPPQLVSERSEAYEVRDLEELIEQIEKITGARLNENKLRGLLTEKKKQDEILCEIYDLMRLVPNPVPASLQWFAYVSNIFAAGTQTQTELYQEV